MARPKSTGKKSTARKATAKKAPAKRTYTRKATAKAKPRAAKAAATKTKTAKQPAIRRPDANLPPTVNVINAMTSNVLNMVEALEDYAANLRALDRQRHNGVGLKRQGFIDAAYRISSKFPQYFPHWLTTAKFKNDIDLFNAIRSLVEVCRSLEEKAWNINVESADMIYTDALEYYSQVQDAAYRRIDAAESIYNELHHFFMSMGKKIAEAPTKKKLNRDFNALERGTKNGEIIVKNFKPKTTGGKHEVLDETYRDSAEFKESEQGEITDA